MSASVTLPPFLVYLYAHKLTLFTSYCIAFLITEQDAHLGAGVLLVLLAGHVNFLCRVK